MCVCVLVCGFIAELGCGSCGVFFKQKTAYEMRIGDWSSDVCSSDLGGGSCRLGTCHGLRHTRLIIPDTATRVLRHILPSPMPNDCGKFALCPDDGPNDEIGRASCRERVCQYE